MKIDKPGIYFDVPIADYHADPCPAPSLTQSIAKLLIDASPAHARLAHPRLCPPTTEDDETEKYIAARAIGNAAHALLTGRGREIFEGKFPDWKTKEARAARDQAQAEGKIVILSKHLTRAVEMVRATRGQLSAAGHPKAFVNGDGEVVTVWQEGNIWLRTMIDWMVTSREVYDLKTSGLSCAPHIIAERPSTDGWDIQAAMHERALDAVDPAGAGRREFFFVAQENEEPYALVPVRIGEADLTLGRRKLDHAVALWRMCMESGVWPAYPAETVISRPRGYLESKWLEREVEHEERRQREPVNYLQAG